MSGGKWGRGGQGGLRKGEVRDAKVRWCVKTWDRRSGRVDLERGSTMRRALVYPAGKKKTKKKVKQMTDIMTKTNCFTVKTRGMHTSSAEYTTFITFEPINRKSGGKATHITVFRKLREEKTKKKQNKKRKQPKSINESTCPRER